MSNTCSVSLNLSKDATKHRYEVRCKDPNGVEVLAGWVKDPERDEVIVTFIKSLGGTDVRFIDTEPPDEKGMISFSADMTSAILKGVKTQTRKVMPFQPQHAQAVHPNGDYKAPAETAYFVHDTKVRHYLPCEFPHDLCEYGDVGDRLQIWDYTREGKPIVLQITALRAERIQKITEADCEGGSKTLVRLDTGEVVDTRDISEAERQIEMEGGGGG